MNANARKQFIINELRDTGSINITDLATRLQVSSMTIRRDLNVMADDGLVTLEHGGAVLNRGSLFEYNMAFKSEINAAEKRSIAHKCLEYISEGDSVFLDAGTTSNELALLLGEKKNINVLTHSLFIANTLAQTKHINLIMCPGEFRVTSMAFLGPLTDDFIEHFQIDTLFLGVEGVDLRDGVSVVDVQDGHTKRVLIEKAKRVICIADSSKFNSSFFYKIAPLRDIDLFITDANLPDAVLEEFQQSNLSVIRAERPQPNNI